MLRMVRKPEVIYVCDSPKPSRHTFEPTSSPYTTRPRRSSAEWRGGRRAGGHRRHTSFKYDPVSQDDCAYQGKFVFAGLLPTPAAVRMLRQEVARRLRVAHEQKRTWCGVDVEFLMQEKSMGIDDYIAETRMRMWAPPIEVLLMAEALCVEVQIRFNNQWICTSGTVVQGLYMCLRNEHYTLRFLNKLPSCISYCDMTHIRETRAGGAGGEGRGRPSPSRSRSRGRTSNRTVSPTRTYNQEAIYPSDGSSATTDHFEFDCAVLQDARDSESEDDPQFNTFRSRVAPAHPTVMPEPSTSRRVYYREHDPTNWCIRAHPLAPMQQVLESFRAARNIVGQLTSMTLC